MKGSVGTSTTILEIPDKHKKKRKKAANKMFSKCRKIDQLNIRLKNATSFEEYQKISEHIRYVKGL